MYLFRVLVIGICLSIFLTACVKTTGEERPRVNCPACGSEFDAFYHKRF